MSAHSTNFSDDENSDCQKSTEYLFTIQPALEEINSDTQSVNSIRKFAAEVQLESQKAKVLIDSGAAVNVMNVKTFCHPGFPLTQNYKIEPEM